MHRIAPLADRVLVKKTKPVEKTVGGIVLPESALGQRNNEAQVIAVGPGSRSRDGAVVPLSVKAGDKVLLGDFGGTEVKVDGEEYHLYREDDILGIFREGNSSSSSSDKKKK